MKKIVVTPAGRKKYLEILSSHLIRMKDEFDEWVLWMNTDCKEDIDYMESLAAAHEFIKICRVQSNIPGLNIQRFFKTCTEIDSLYLRLDDDIVFIEDGSIREIFSKREQDTTCFLLYGNILNNATVAHLHQRLGIIEYHHDISYKCLDTIVWKNASFAEMIHNLFFAAFLEGNVRKFFMPDHVIEGYKRFSINAICWRGESFKDFRGSEEEEGIDEEQFLSCSWPERARMPCKIIGNTLFSHLAFGPQRKSGLNEAPLLRKYGEIAEKMASDKKVT